MEITWLKNEDNAIQYVYASAVPQKIPLDIFKEIVQSSKENCQIGRASCRERV